PQVAPHRHPPGTWLHDRFGSFAMLAVSAERLLILRNSPSKRTFPIKQHHHSITSSARASSVGGTSMPSALAVLRLITSSYLGAACTGRLAGLSPWRIRST